MKLREHSGKVIARLLISTTRVPPEFPRDNNRTSNRKVIVRLPVSCIWIFLRASPRLHRQITSLQTLYPTDSKSDSDDYKIIHQYIKEVARQGSEVTFECNSNSIAQVDSFVRWTKEGKNIDKNAKTRNKYGFQEGANGFSLNIKNVSMQDTGEYECVVTLYSGIHQKVMKATRELQIFQKGM